jgi:ABC-type glycerol-3-phosphate transport system permease component
MAAGVAVPLPILVIFFCARNYFVEGIVTSGMGGR